MIKVDNNTKTISINRGDDNVSFNFSIPIDSTTNYTFKTTDVIKFGVYTAKKLEDKALILKEIHNDEEKEVITITLSKQDTSIGDIENKPVKCWYEIQLNDDTIIGFDEKGAKEFIVYPEGSDEQ